MTRLEEDLLRKGLLSRERLDEAAERARREARPLPAVLLEDGIIEESELLRALAAQYGLEFVTLGQSTESADGQGDSPQKGGSTGGMPYGVVGEPTW